jgi:hypothetical protein
MKNRMKSRRNTYKRKTRRASSRKHRFFTRKNRRGRVLKGGGFAYVPPPTAIVPFRRMEETDMADTPVMMTYEEAKELKKEL